MARILRFGLFLSLASIINSQSLNSNHESQNSRLNFFDIDLFHYATEDKRGNVAVSPASLKATLAMILEGAGGATAEEIRSALRLSPVAEEFREQLSSYLTAIDGSRNYTNAVLRNSNAIFASVKLKVNSRYETLLRTAYSTVVCRTNFADPVSAAQSINSWIFNSTNGLIPTIIEPAHLTPASELLFTNALFFKAGWQHGFDPGNTRGGCFYRHGVCCAVAMMETRAEFPYLFVDNLRAHAVELPYQGGIYSMIVLVPLEREGLPALVRDLPYMSLNQISALFKPTDVTLTLPRFTIDYTDDMVATLKNMRITTLFGATANLSGVFEGQSASINSLLHKVYMDVDETGTVAAAASAGMVIPLILDEVQVRVDRPFLFFIMDREQGLVLFGGKVEEPAAYVDKNGLIGHREKHGDRGSRKRHRHH